MFFMKRSDIIFRNYVDFGYITDNRNFRYRNAQDVIGCIGDKIISETGAVFFSVLDEHPKHIKDIVNKIIDKFIDADIELVTNDAKDFYGILEKEGFIVSGESSEICLNKSVKSSFNSIVDCAVGSSKEAEFNKKKTQDFFEGYFKGKPQLVSVHIELTSKCNERCIHCYIPHENKFDELENGLLSNILNQCQELNVQHLTVSGGEPMLHKNFLDLIVRCKENNFSVSLLSNLTLLTDEILRELKRNPLLGVQTSLYSMQSSVHDEITRLKGSFEKTKNAILRLVDAGVPVQISCPILRQNRKYFDEVVEWGRKYNIHVSDDYVVIGSYDCINKNLTCRLSINEIKNLIDHKISHNKKYLQKIEEEAAKRQSPEEGDFVCSVCSSSICISEKGNAYPCAGWQGYVLGNVKEMTIDDIWNNSAKVKYLRGLRKSDFPKCMQCSYSKYCTMCMVRNANENKFGDMLQVNNYFCEIAKHISEICSKR